MTRLLSPFGLTNNKEDTADCFQDAIHALYENADREKAMHLLLGHFAGHRDSMSGWPNHNAHTETPHTRLVTTPIAKVMPTAAAVMSRLVTTRRLILIPERNATMIET